VCVCGGGALCKTPTLGDFFPIEHNTKDDCPLVGTVHRNRSMGKLILAFVYNMFYLKLPRYFSCTEK